MWNCSAGVSMEREFTLDLLPFDCIVTICECLRAEDLARFSGVCKVFYDAAQVGYLWRRHCLNRWMFCDIHQISEGPHRWLRYFQARRTIEVKIDTGRPIKDYKVRTLRGHETDIVSVVCLGGGVGVNWENPLPPVVVSLSADGYVKAWDVQQGKVVWSVEGEQVSCIASSDSLSELVLGKEDGSVQVWATGKWDLKVSFHSSSGGTVTSLHYCAFRLKQKVETFLILHTFSNQLEVWDTVALTAFDLDPQPDKPIKPVLQLWAPTHIGQYRISSSGLLSVEAEFGDVHVFDMQSLSINDTPPHRPHVTLNTSDRITTSCWVEPCCLATVTQHSATIDVWNVGSHLDALKKARRSLYNDSNIFSPTQSISNEFPAVCMCVVNKLLITGDMNGVVRVINLKIGEILQHFHDHKGIITDMHTDRFRVLTCSRDFSIRVYRWQESTEKGKISQLESRYTLLGGSVAHKTHDGFRRLLCGTSYCVGVAGSQLKFYNFTTKLEPYPK